MAEGERAPLGLLLDGALEHASEASSIFEEIGDRPGYVCNLGHGVTPPTPLENVAAFVEAVKSFAPATSEGEAS